MTDQEGRPSAQGLDQTRYGKPPLSPTGEPLAHPGLRAAAFMIDGFATVLIATLVVGLGFFLNLPFLIGFGVVGVPTLAAIAATISTAMRGVTLGKHVLGLRVIDARSGSFTGWRAPLRSLVIVAPLLVTYALQSATPAWSNTTVALLGAPTLPVLLWLALLVVVALAPRHRGLQDLAGRSLVTRRP